ncbi:MAG TPA: nitroreductase/quinone reductase family protein [Acidimicrobiia bacterium]|nr:nitroreductase/quinone reductase family protein [Acidimicrobiia bacterium]
MTDAPDMNRHIIEEFRANGGRVSGPAEAFSLLLLHTRGARSGAERVNPVAYQPLADAWAVFATHAGAPKHPAWYHNVVAHPETIIEVGTETIPVRARVAVGEERERIWARQKVFYPRFARYEAQTAREIPVVILERLSARRPGSRALDVS